MTRAAVRRLKTFMGRRRLMFVFVGDRPANDRVISTFDETPNGATVSNRAYNALLRDIVNAVRKGA